jgi:uncharacterized protein (DUF58 family)
MELKESALAVIGASLTLILLGLLTGGFLFYIAAALAAVFLAADYYRLTITMDDLRSRLDVKYGLSRNEVYLGATTLLICRLTYNGRSNRTVLVRQPLDPELTADGAWGPVSISPDSTKYLRLTLRTPAGGTFTISPPSIEAESWLFRDSYPAGKTHRLNVLLPLGAQMQRVGRPAPRMNKSLGIFDATTMKKGQGVDFYAIRKYEGGDSMKRVDWIRSSRANQLMVRDYEDDQPLPAFFIIDLAPSMGRSEGLKSAISLTTALFNKIHVNWERIGIIAFSPAGVVQYLPPRIGSAQLHDMRAILSNLKATDSKVDSRHYQEALPYELKNVFREGEAGMLVNQTLREYMANIRDDGFSRAIMTALKAVNTPSRLFIMTDVSMGMMSLMNNLRIARYYGHKVSVVLLPRTWHDEEGLAMEESVEIMQKLNAYGIEAAIMGPEDTPDSVIRRGGIVGLHAGGSSNGP